MIFKPMANENRVVLKHSFYPEFYVEARTVGARVIVSVCAADGELVFETAFEEENNRPPFYPRGKPPKPF